MMGQLAMRKILPFLSALVMAGFAVHASADTCGTSVGVDDATPDNITVNTTWGGLANPSPICLNAPIFVKSGATLTILPGTIVRGQPRSAAPGGVAGSPGALVITRTGKVISDGTANNPIIFTTAAVDNDGNGAADDLDANGRLDRWPGFVPGGGCPGACTPAVAGTFLDGNPKTAPLPPLNSAGNGNITMWGGVMILGKAPTNLANTYGTPFGHGTGFVEGLVEPGFDTSDGTCGGLEPHDSSGIVRYTSVRHGGDEIGASNEINGFTLCAVGDNTIFEFNEVYANFDDAFEFFGGTVNVNHLVAEYVGDDNYDVDWGYTGGMQFLFAIKPFFRTDANANFGQAGGDGLVEADGTDYEQEPGNGFFNVNVRTAYSAAVFGGDPLAQVPASTNKAPWPMSGPFIANYTGIGGQTDAGANPSPPAFNAPATKGVQYRRGFAGQVLNSLFVNLGAGTACHAVDTTASQAPAGFDMTSNATNDLIRLVSSSCDSSAALAGAAVTSANNGDNFASNETQGATCGTVNYANIRASGGGFAGLVQENAKFNGKVFGGAAYDPRPAGAGADCGIMLKVPGFDRAATYRGAFPPGQPLWTDGWTVLDSVGLL
jgi:hypothetical protein